MSKHVHTFIFFSEYRQKCGLLLLHPEMRYHVREIARLTDTTAGTLHRELSKLSDAEVLIREVSGNQVYYKANTTFPLFDELASILRKTSGLTDVLAEALRPHANKIKVAFIYGSVGRGTENSNSDIDVLIIGDISFTDAVKALYAAQDIVKCEINPKVTTSEWKKLIKSNTIHKSNFTRTKLFIRTRNDIR